MAAQGPRVRASQDELLGDYEMLLRPAFNFVELLPRRALRIRDRQVEDQEVNRRDSNIKGRAELDIERV